MDKAPAGRSRGRARGSPTVQSPPAAPQGAWARRPDVSPVVPPASIGRSVRAPAPAVAHPGGGDHALAVPIAQDRPVDAAGDAGPAGRGAMRGRRVITSELLLTRPQHIQSKRGTSGQPLQLTANYFKVMTKPDWCLYRYNVDFSPDEDRTVVRKGLLRIHRERLGAFIFDGNTLYTSNRLSAQDQPVELYSVRQSDQENIKITIKLTGDMVKGDPQYLQFYNILTRKCLEHLHLQLVGRNYFDANARVEIREFQFEVWPGYLTSIRQHETDVLMCAEINHKVMRQETLLDILTNVRQSGPSGDYQNACRAEVIGLTVLTDYNNNTYRVDDIDFSANPMSTFHLRKEDRDVSYKDYYMNKYNIRVRNETQPMLVTRSKARDRRAGEAEIVYLIPELCRATGLTDTMRNNFQLMSAMAQHTRLVPERRIERLLAFNRRLHEEPAVKKEFRDWNLNLDTNLVRLPGRLLPKEKIFFANQKFTEPEFNGDWTKAIRDNSLFLGTKLMSWVVIVPGRNSQDAQRFVEGMQRSVKGFQIGRPQVEIMQRDQATDYVQTLERVLSKTNPQMVMCILGRNRADTYSAIKKKCCIDRPVPSQVVTARCFNPKGMMSIATKVAIQLNCKIGGIPWTIHIPLTRIMVIGYDVCHDTNNRGTDFGAMVASLDPSSSRYFSAVTAHTTGEELSNSLATNVVKALRRYRETNNGARPSHILMYRDGVGEGQIPFVMDHEVKNVERAIEAFYEKQEPVKLGYIIVTKRINTRFFQGTKNPLPGTVVDDVVTNPMRYDFFLISQSVKQGTVAPTSYSVIHDTLGLSPDRLQILTYKLTHTYFNCSSSMSVPAPVQFAHKLAFLVSQSIHTAPTSQALESLLYFL